MHNTQQRFPDMQIDRREGEAVMGEEKRGRPALQSEVAPLRLCVLGYELALILAWWRINILASNTVSSLTVCSLLAECSTG